MPACEYPREIEDCCTHHGHERQVPAFIKRNLAERGFPAPLADDGVIDEVGIEVALEGTRPIALTWLEREIGAATIIAKGGFVKDAAYFLGTSDRTMRDNYPHVFAMADAIKADADA